MVLSVWIRVKVERSWDAESGVEESDHKQRKLRDSDRARRGVPFPLPFPGGRDSRSRGLTRRTRLTGQALRDRRREIGSGSPDTGRVRRGAGPAGARTRVLPLTPTAPIEGGRTETQEARAYTGYRSRKRQKGVAGFRYILLVCTPVRGQRSGHRASSRCPGAAPTPTRTIGPH